MKKIARRKSVTIQNWSVKVYLLNDLGNWDDCGTGLFEYEKDIISGKETEYLKVIAKEGSNNNNLHPESLKKIKRLSKETQNEKCLLNFAISRCDQVEKQEDLIISWVDKESGEELALSFVECSAAKEAWSSICRKLGKNPSDDEFEDLDDILIPDLDNLGEIKRELLSEKSWMISVILENDVFLDNLQRVFEEAETFESLYHLRTIYEIIRILIFSEDINLLGMLLSEKYYLLVFGALEYNPYNPGKECPRYREFLTKQSSYKEVIKFSERMIIKKIHLNHRINYLKDVLTSSTLDDPLSNLFNPISYCTNRYILEHILTNYHYVEEILNKVSTCSYDAIGFLHELIQLVKTLRQNGENLEYKRTLIQNKGLNAISKAMETLDSQNNCIRGPLEKKNAIKIQIIDILSFLVQTDIDAFTEFLKSSDSKGIITGVINNISYGDLGLQTQTGDFIRSLIDGAYDNRNEILDVFYDSILPAFVAHFKTFRSDETFISFFGQFIDILIHCLKSHGYRIRHYIIHHKLLNKLCQGFKKTEKSIHLALIKFIKAITRSKDDYLIKYLAHNHLLDQMFEVYTKNAHKKNLIHSSCLEFFEILRKENIRRLIIEIIERFRDKINEFSLEKDFERLLCKYDQIMEESSHEIYHESGNISNRIRLSFSTNLSDDHENQEFKELSSMEDEEYFEAEDENEEEYKDSETPTLLEKDFNPEELQRGQFSDNIISDKELKSKENLKKIKEKISSKKFEGDYDNSFTLGDKGRIRSLSSEKALINLQFNLSANEKVVNIKRSESLNMKRPGGDLASDIEIKEIVKIEPQKKIKM